MYQWKKKVNKVESGTRARSFFLCWLVVLWLVGLCPDCNAFEYESYGRRDPFVPLVGVAERVSISGARGILTIDDVSLQGIVVGADGKPAVIINGEILKQGDRIERLYIESIGNNIVTIMIDEEKFKLKLYE